MWNKRNNSPKLSYALIECDVFCIDLRCRTFSASCRIRYRIRCFIRFKFRGPKCLHWAWVVSAPFADSVPFSSLTPSRAPTAIRSNSYALPPIPPRPACLIPPLADLPWPHDFLGSMNCDPAQHAENCGMRRRCAAAAVPACAATGIPVILWLRRSEIMKHS